MKECNNCINYYNGRCTLGNIAINNTCIDWGIEEPDWLKAENEKAEEEVKLQHLI